LFLGLPVSSLNGQQAPSPAAEAAAAVKLKEPGLPNLGRVNQRLYRGGQPEAKGFDALRRLGVEIVVDLNTSQDAIRRERAEVESRGMRYLSIPWSARSLPSKEQVEEFLRLTRDHPRTRIFVHCHHGADRTGVMVAAYRMAFEGWTPEQALAEMERFKFHGFWYRHLKQYVRDFPALLRSDPEFISALSLASRPN
jgi:protein tyrosine/serine phosphatase